MPVVNGIKLACAPCMRGHRATTCMHHDRVLLEVRKPGRPLSSCPHNSDNCSCDAVTANKLGGTKTSTKRYRKIEKKAAKRARTNSPGCRDSSKDGFRCTGCSAKDRDPRAGTGREVEAEKLLQRHSPSSGETILPVAESPQTHGSHMNDSSRSYHSSEITETLRPAPLHSNSPQTLPSIYFSTINSTQLPSTAVIPPSNASYEIPRAHVIEIRRPRDPFLPNVPNMRKPDMAAAIPALQDRQLPPLYLQASRLEDISFYNMETLPRIRRIDESDREGNAEQKVDARNWYSGTAYNLLAGTYDPEPRIIRGA